MIQLDLFESCEVTILRWELKKVKETSDKVRKSLFAKNGDLDKKYLHLLGRVEELEKQLCQRKS